MEETTCYCSIVAYIEPEHQRLEIEQLFNDFFEDIKLPFDVIEFDHSKGFVAENRERLENVHGVLKRYPQSLAISLFLKEDSDQEYTLKRYLKISPWQLDHVIENSLTKRPQKIARQEFYSCSKDLPLMSVSSVHYGNEHVRIHIFVKNFYAMKKFYEGITDRKAKHCGPNFCFLTIFSEDGLDVQIGLKKNPAVSPLPSTSLRLKFRIQSVSPLFKYLASSQYSTNEAKYMLQDPDGNDVIVERSYAKVSSDHCKQFQSISKVDENNNFEGISEEDLNSSGRKHMWNKYDYSEHGLFPQEAMSIGDLTKNHEEDESENQNVVHRSKKDYITFM